jgi:hypothetical protein
MPKFPIYESLKVVSLEMNETCTQKLKRIAKLEERSFAHLCRSVLSDFIEKYEKKHGKIKLSDKG